MSRREKNRQTIAGSRKALDEGDAFGAVDQARAALAAQPNSAEARCLLARGLARAGSPDAALEALKNATFSGRWKAERLGIIASALKDIALCEADPRKRRGFLRDARQAYDKAAAADPTNYWAFINAATISRILNPRDRSRTRAKKARQAAEEAIQEKRHVGRNGSYWGLATLAEAEILLGNEDEARQLLQRAMRERPNALDRASTRRQIRRLMQALGRDPHEFDDCLPMPTILVFSGHMIDPRERRVPRFPARLEDVVSQAIRERLPAGELLVWSGAACGSDILFLENCLDRGAEVNVVLPCSKDRFVVESVARGGNEDWVPRFERIWQESHHPLELSPLRGDVAPAQHEYVNRILLGLASMRARTLDTRVRGLAVLDATSSALPGGTASAVRYWRSRGVGVDTIDLTALRVGKQRQTSRKSARAPSKKWTIAALLFGDLKNFSRLTDAQIATYVGKVLPKIAALATRYRSCILDRNTWGDGVHLTFSDIERAGMFALELQEELTLQGLEALGLPEGTAFRVALHAGPVRKMKDRLRKVTGFFGNEVTLAARVEPETEVGAVFVTEEFAALASSNPKSVLHFDYLRHFRLPKKYGHHRICRMSRAPVRSLG